MKASQTCPHRPPSPNLTSTVHTAAFRRWALQAELLCVLRVQSLPAELHGLRTNDASDRNSAEQVIQNIETNVPPGSTHCDKAVTDVGPQREVRAANNGFEFPAHLKVAPLVLKHPGSIGSRYFCFGHV